jgi:uncharacterized membrane protein
MASGKHGTLNFKRNFIAGLLTVIPLAITLWLFQFLFKLLSQFGQPVVRAIQKDLGEETPVLSVLFRQPWFDDLLAVVIVVVAIYVLGVVAGRVIGAQILHVGLRRGQETRRRAADQAGERRAGGADQLPHRAHAHRRPGHPHAHRPTHRPAARRGLRADDLEVVPVDDLVSTNWTIDEAMNFIISGGAIAPDSIPFSRDAPESATNQPPAG